MRDSLSLLLLFVWLGGVVECWTTTTKAPAPSQDAASLCASVPPGEPYSTTITPADITDVEVTVGGDVVAVDVLENDDGSYTLTVDGVDMVEPGPVLIREGETILERTEIG